MVDIARSAPLIARYAERVPVLMRGDIVLASGRIDADALSSVLDT